MRRCLSVILLFLLLVRGVHAQDTPADVFIEAMVDQPAPFVGQQFVYLVRVYEAADRVDTSPLYEPPSFEGLWRIEVQPFPFLQTSQRINNREYVVSEIRAALYATRPGEILIAPASVVLPETVFRPEQRVSSNVVTVQAQPLPEGAPDEFNGAVGQFEMTAALDRQTLTLGEPVTLRLTVRGTGNVEPLPSPDVIAPDGWQMFADPATYTTLQDNAGRIVGEKVYEWVFIPNAAGTTELPTITLVYFDPASLSYRTLETAPTTITVQPGNATALPTAPPAAVPEASPSVPVKPAPAELGTPVIRPAWWFWILWLIAPTGAAVSAGWLYRQQRRQRDRVKLRRSAALERANMRLQIAAGLAVPQVYQAVSATIWSYVGDKLDCAPQQLSHDDIGRLLVERRIPPEIGQRVLLCLERSSEGLYAPSSTADARQLVSQTRDSLMRLEAAWETR